MGKIEDKAGYQKATEEQKQPNIPTVQEVKNQMQNDWLNQQKQPAMSLEEVLNTYHPILRDAELETDLWGTATVKMAMKEYANQLQKSAIVKLNEHITILLDTHHAVDNARIEVLRYCIRIIEGSEAP